MRRIGLEKILQRETPLPGSKIVRRFRRHVQKRIPRGPAHVVLNLGDQRRNKIEGLMDVGKLVQQFDHSVVVFERMQAHPGQAVLAGDQILVKRLVLMPENHDAQDGHEGEISRFEASSLAGGQRLAR